MKNEIDQLIERVQEIAADEKFARLSTHPPRVQVMVGLGRSFMARHLDYDMVKYFFDMEVRLKAQLKSKIFSYEQVPDDTIIRPEVGYDYGAAGTLANSLFGVPAVFDKQKDPWSAQEPVIHSPADLDRLQIADFFETDPMPIIHKNYERLCQLVDGRLTVTFPGWARSPWSVACFLRGFTPLYLDIIDRPDFVKELLDFIVESRISWEKQRSEFLNLSPEDIKNTYSNCYVDYRTVHVSDYYSDEVDGAMFSPRVYEEIVFPAELKLARFYGGVRYYHSCGNLTPFLDTLLRLPNLKILHVSSWTDLKTAYEKSDQTVILQKVMHPTEDVLDADESQIRAHVKEILATVPDRVLHICADAIYSGDLEKVKSWLQTTREVVNEADR